MKRFAYATVTLFLVAISCSKIDTGIMIFPQKVDYVEDIISSSSDNHVSLNEIHQVISRDFPITKTHGYSYKVNPYISENQDTLMYVVNFGSNDGWKIYSSDKRTPAILAEGENGYFSLEDGSPAAALWISSMSNDIAKVKRATDEELIFNKDEVSSHKIFWQQPRIDPNLPIIPYPGGHWEETIIGSMTIEDTVINHMVSQWHQNEPYNMYSPYYVNDPDTRALAGCVAVAGAQVLYYLHNKLQTPSQMYSQGYCVGNIDGYERVLTNLSETVWDSMSMNMKSDSTVSVPEAILIAHVADMVNMHYCDNIFGQYSWALPVNLKTYLFDYHGISCSHGNYDEEIVENSLLNQMPVIVSASNLLIPVDTRIHCFVIDGYRSTRTEYTHYHYYVWDVPPTEPYLPFESYTTKSYSPASVTAIKINWGWKTQWKKKDPVNDGWFTLTGRWVLDDGGDYNHNKKIIYDFAVAE